MEISFFWTRWKFLWRGFGNVKFEIDPGKMIDKFDNLFQFQINTFHILLLLGVSHK